MNFYCCCLVVVFSQLLCCSVYTIKTLCIRNDYFPKYKMATKTGYFNLIVNTTFEDEFTKNIKGCSAHMMWFLSRHGTRYPLEDEQQRYYNILPKLKKELIENYSAGRGCLNADDILKLKNWDFPYSLRDKGELHEVGSEELFHIGSQMLKSYPVLFNASYDEKKFKVQFTVKNRTYESAYHFLRGMFGDDAIGSIPLPYATVPDYLLRISKSCPRWMNEVYRKSETYTEQHLFESTYQFQLMLRNVSARLGYLSVLDIKKVLAIYDECRYETAWFPKHHSIWCFPFYSPDLDVLEYHQDLKYFYEDSYGMPLNLDLTCQLFVDLKLHMSKAVKEEVAFPCGVFYFSHDKTLTKFYSRLGLFKPEKPLQHGNFEYNKDPGFRAGRMSPFASNISFVLYRCGTVYKVAALLHGYHIKIPNYCQDILCSWDDFKMLLDDASQYCDIYQICQLHDELR